jgi:hypothetical protein
MTSLFQREKMVDKFAPKSYYFINMKKNVKLLARSLVWAVAAVLVCVAAVTLSACGKKADSKITAIKSMTAVRGTEDSGGSVLIQWRLAENFDYAKWTGNMVIWVSKIDGIDTDIALMSDGDRAIYETRTYIVYNNVHFDEELQDFNYRFSFGGLPHGKTYVFSIKAELEGDKFGETSISGAVELSLTVPSKVRLNYSDAVEFYDSGRPVTRVMWHAPLYNGGSPIIHYKVSTNGGETYTPYPVTYFTNGLSLQIPGEIGPVLSNLRIIAVNAQGESEPYGG